LSVERVDEDEDEIRMEMDFHLPIYIHCQVDIDIPTIRYPSRVWASPPWGTTVESRGCAECPEMDTHSTRSCVRFPRDIVRHSGPGSSTREEKDPPREISHAFWSYGPIQLVLYLILQPTNPTDAVA